MHETIEKIKNKSAKARKEFRTRLVTLILAGFGLVASLAWNEAIRGLIDNFYPSKTGILPKFIYAIVVTIIFVLFTLILGHFLEDNNNEQK